MKKLIQKYKIAKNRLEKFEEEIENIAFGIARKIDEATGGNLHSYDKFEINDTGSDWTWHSDIPAQNIACYWEDFWSYGGNDAGRTCFPLYLLYEPEGLDAYLENIKLEKEAAEKKRNKL